MNDLPQIQGYTLTRELGQGGFGHSYLATEDRSQTLCVIKALNMKRLEDWKSLELFEREAKVLKQISHPRIPRFLDFIKQENPEQHALYLIQSYVPGDSLKDLVQQGKRFREDEVQAIALDIAEILVYLQKLTPPLIHRDIKPGNIILSEKNQVHLIDFGAVRDFITGAEGSSTVIGSFGYMAPEQFQGRAQTQTDVYGLGATLLYALSHKHPNEFNTQGLKILFRRELHISTAFADVLEKMLEPNWEQRYSANEVLADLKALQTGQLTSLQNKQVEQSLQAAKSKPGLEITSKHISVALLAFGGLLALLIFAVNMLFPQQAVKGKNVSQERLYQVMEEVIRSEARGNPEAAVEQFRKERQNMEAENGGQK